MRLLNLTSAGLLLILGGCAAPRQVAFNEADFTYASARGSGVVTGRAYVVTDDQGTLYPHCQAIILAARTRAMQSINRHKSAGAWAEGPPA